MAELYEKDRHEPLINRPWSEDVAKLTIKRLYTECINTFEGDKLWPVHPDIAECFKTTQSLTGVWSGLAGTFWALYKLAQDNPSFPQYDFIPYLTLLEQQQAERLKPLLSSFSTIDPESVGYLLGYSGSLLVQWQYTQDNSLLARLEEYIISNLTNDNNELMWSTSGTGLVAWFLYQKTNDQKWANLFKLSAKRIFDTWNYDKNSNNYLWIQDMYGTKNQYLGLVHGFAGNVFVLLQGFDLLDKEQQNTLIKQTLQTIINTAKTNATQANWANTVPIPGLSHNDEPFFQSKLVQFCHGAPSMLIGLAKLWPYMDKEIHSIFIKAGNLVWDAGPLVKPWGLCHGTAGNGYVFLKLYTLTKDESWLQKARSFAMHAICQSEQMQDKYKMIRVDNWCGDMGLALYLQDCVHGTSEFPMLDYF